MKRSFFYGVPLLLLFVFVFSMVVAISSPATAGGDYSCCKVKWCWPDAKNVFAYGVLIDGVCVTSPTAYNPNGCTIKVPSCP